MHLFVLLLVVSSTYATEYEDYQETQEQIVDEELLSEIFEQNELELRKIGDNNLNADPNLIENVRKKRLQITPIGEQGNHFPVFDFDTKPKIKRTTAAPVTTTTVSQEDEQPPIKKFSFRLLENTTSTTEAPELEEVEESENLVNTESLETPEKSQNLEEEVEEKQEPKTTEKKQELTEKSPEEEILQGKESTISHGLPRINPGYLQVRHKGVSSHVNKAENNDGPSPYDKFTTPSPEVSTLPAFFTTPAPAYFNPLGPVYPGIHGNFPGHVQVPHFKNFEYHQQPPQTYHSSIKYPDAPAAPEPTAPEPTVPEPAPVEEAKPEALRIPEEPQVPVFETNHEEPAKEHPFAETLFPTTEPATNNAKLVSQFTTPKPFVSSLGANGQVTPAPGISEGAVVSALPPMTSPYVPPYGPTPAPHPGLSHGLPHLGPHGFSTPAPHFDLGHPGPHYGPPAVALPEPGYGVPEPAYGVPEPGYGVPGPVHSLPDPGYGVPEPAYGLPPLHHPEPGYGVPEPIHPVPVAGYGVPEPVIHHPVPSAGYGVPEPIHHVSSLHPTPHHVVPHPEPGYGVPEPVLNDPAHPFHFEFSGLPEHPHPEPIHPVPAAGYGVPEPIHHGLPEQPPHQHISIFSTPSPVHEVHPVHPVHPVTPVPVGHHVVHHGTPTPLPGHPVPHGKKFIIFSRFLFSNFVLL